MTTHTPETGATGCQWPRWADADRPPRPAVFCGCPRVAPVSGRRLPYCQAHAAIAYAPDEARPGVDGVRLAPRPMAAVAAPVPEPAPPPPVPTAAERDAAALAAVAEMQAAGVVQLRRIARGLNERGLTTPRGKPWQHVAVMQLFARAG